MLIKTQNNRMKYAVLGGDYSKQIRADVKNAGVIDDLTKLFAPPAPMVHWEYFCTPSDQLQLLLKVF